MMKWVFLLLLLTACAPLVPSTGATPPVITTPAEGDASSGTIPPHVTTPMWTDCDPAPTSCGSDTVCAMVLLPDEPCAGIEPCQHTRLRTYSSACAACRDQTNGTVMSYTSGACPTTD